MASPDKSKQKILKAKKTMPKSSRKQMDILNKPKNVEALKTIERGSSIPNSHNQKKRVSSQNKENVKRMKTSEQINENTCVSLERQTALLEQVKHLIRQELCRISYKVLDEKLNELSERIGKTQCRNKHEAIACELFVKIGRLQRRMKAVLPSETDCLEPSTLSSNTVCRTAPSNVKNLDKNQEAVNDPNKRVTPVNPNPLQPSEKTSQIINLSEDLVKFVSESNIDDVMVITVANPHLKNSVTSHPTEIRKTTPENFKNSPNAKFDGGNPAPVLMPPSKADLSPKAITPVAENGVEESGSFDHLPPLPEPPPILRELTDNVLDTLPPQKPELRVKQILRPWGIALTWNIPKINPRCAPVESYHLFLCYESSKDKLTWKKIGEIKALPLPMACTLSQFLTASKYYFTIQSKDIFGRYGPFCDIKCIPGFSENLT
uniref:Activating transcription factor 7 interacting protein 2 n=1 Tax=Jaculus jaculus TaxID=51337 RepID=A0A8C5JY18_JACJA